MALNKIPTPTLSFLHHLAIGNQKSTNSQLIYASISTSQVSSPCTQQEKRKDISPTQHLLTACFNYWLQWKETCGDVTITPCIGTKLRHICADDFSNDSFNNNFNKRHSKSHYTITSKRSRTRGKSHKKGLEYPTTALSCSHNVGKLQEPLAKKLNYQTNWDQLVDPYIYHEFLSKLYVPIDKEEGTTRWDASCLRHSELEVLVDLKEENVIKRSQLGNFKITVSFCKLTNYFPDN